MKVGETRSDESMRIVTSEHEYELGVMRLNHPRCGKVEIRRQKSGKWKVTKCERPDP